MDINNEIKDIWHKYEKAKPNFINIGLRYENPSKAVKYFCTPLGAKIFASMGVGGIHYCTIKGYGEYIFAVVPEPCSDQYVIPIATDIKDFLETVILLHGTQLIDQIVQFDKAQFEKMLAEHYANADSERTKELAELKGIVGVPDGKTSPYEHISQLNASFDKNKLKFSDEYYDILGIDPDDLT